MCRLSVEGYSRNSHDDLGEGELKGWEAEGQGAEEASFSGHILLQMEHLIIFKTMIFKKSNV